MEYHVEETTIAALTRTLIETPSPVSYYEEIHPLMERLAKQYGYTLTYDRKRTAYIPVSYTHLDVYKRQLPYPLLR